MYAVADFHAGADTTLCGKMAIVAYFIIVAYGGAYHDQATFSNQSPGGNGNMRHDHGSRPKVHIRCNVGQWVNKRGQFVIRNVQVFIQLDPLLLAVDPENGIDEIIPLEGHGSTIGEFSQNRRALNYIAGFQSIIQIAGKFPFTITAFIGVGDGMGNDAAVARSPQNKHRLVVVIS